MALLYERSAVWRTIVAATRDPRLMLVFSVVTAGGAYGIARGSKAVTDVAAEEVKDDLETSMRRDREAARYAEHSKKALATMFDSFRRGRGEQVADDPGAAHNKHPIKLPGVMWHPKVAQRERELAKEKSAAAMAVNAEEEAIAKAKPVAASASRPPSAPTTASSTS